MNLKTRLRALESRDMYSTPHIVLKPRVESAEAAMAAYSGYIGPNDNRVFMVTGITRHDR